MNGKTIDNTQANNEESGVIVDDSLVEAVANDVLISIAEFTEAVALIETAVGSIDTHTQTAIQGIDQHIETDVKKRIDQLAVDAINRAIQANQRLRDLLDPFLDPIRTTLGW